MRKASSLESSLSLLNIPRHYLYAITDGDFVDEPEQYTRAHDLADEDCQVLKRSDPLEKPSLI